MIAGACSAPGSSMSFAAKGAEPSARPARADQIARGRYLIVTHDCGGCHGGGSDPAAKGWLAGMRDTSEQFRILGFITRPKNLTPDNTTGMGRYTERQVFNALRYGLRPEETPDVEITSTTPGKGNFPLHPHYLAPPMPWMAWRHMPDEDLHAIIAYLRDGLKPAHNKVEDSEGPPDFWAGAMTVENIGSYPVAAFPTVNEKK
jgi:mono/diheme cytochrome c family protein